MQTTTVGLAFKVFKAARRKAARSAEAAAGLLSVPGPGQPAKNSDVSTAVLGGDDQIRLLVNQLGPCQEKSSRGIARRPGLTSAAVNSNRFHFGCH